MKGIAHGLVDTGGAPSTQDVLEEIARDMGNHMKSHVFTQFSHSFHMFSHVFLASPRANTLPTVALRR